MGIKPLKVKAPASKPAPSTPTSEKNELKAVRIVMEMSDGSVFEAEGDAANAVWHYQMECEQIANASGTLPSYLGPGLERVSKSQWK